MEELRIIIEVKGFNHVIYDSLAQWENLSLSVIHGGSGTVEAWSVDINNPEKMDFEYKRLLGKVERFLLSVEWAYGFELNYKIINVIKPSFINEKNSIVIIDNIQVTEHWETVIEPRKVPDSMPQVPIEAKRWIKIWIESNKLNEYVEEQLRRQYLIIEELWQELHHIFDTNRKDEKKQVKLIRDFVSHASCDNQDIISLVENDLPDAVQFVNDKKYVSFMRTVEHRNYISRFEVKSREIARSLVNHKMKQLGIVNGV